MSERTDSNQLSTELQRKLKELQSHRDVLQQFTDTDRFPPAMTMHYLGCAIMRLLSDESFYTDDRNAEGAELLLSHFSATYRLLCHIEEREIS